jgi:hypothetical protein
MGSEVICSVIDGSPASVIGSEVVSFCDWLKIHFSDWL